MKRTLTLKERNYKKKYPNTKYFEWYNANPKGNLISDCAIRALCVVLDMSWEDVYMDLCKRGLANGCMPSDRDNLYGYLEEKGFVRMKMPKNEKNKKVRVCSYHNELKKYHKVFASVGKYHVVGIDEGVVKDIWDSSTQFIGVWFVPKEYVI